ncbi:hypothetical protein KY342_00635 [Candidatus Woesearchaeota archaeon]|nr:hypothetical protein [Candidatus Woesearchaeota archaeon]
METGRIIVSIIFFVLGLVFFFNNKNMSKFAAKFYKWLYTEKNLRVIFRIVGIILIVGGVLILVLK